MYHVLLPDLESRTAFIEKLHRADIVPVFHCIPLHSALAGTRDARAHGEFKVTDEMADRLVRLPLWSGLEEHQAEVIQHILAAI